MKHTEDEGLYLPKLNRNCRDNIHCVGSSWERIFKFTHRTYDKGTMMNQLVVRNVWEEVNE